MPAEAVSTRTIPNKDLVDMTAISTDPQQRPQEPDKSSTQTPMTSVSSIPA